MARSVDGTVWVFGYNGKGQLGDGTTANRLTPAQLKDPPGMAILTGVGAIAAGFEHSLALPR